MTPILSIHHVGADGRVSLVSANVPYANLQWTRRFSSVGEFSVQLACPCPVSFPGRYLVTLYGRDEVGVVEKAECDEGGDGSPCSLSGRFAESIWDRYRLGSSESVSGADWRQAVTSALSKWHMPDIPALVMGDGTSAPTGKSYVITDKPGASAMELVYSTASANGCRPLVSYSRDAGSALSVSIVGGLDRTRGQTDNPVCVFALSLASAVSASYTGDYSTSCSEVVARAAKDGAVGSVDVEVTRRVAVPGFDAATMWQAIAFEDVSSFLGDGEIPTAAFADRYGLLRAYDHMPELAIDCVPVPAGYGSWWDLGDIVEVEMPSSSIAASARIEEVREVHKPEGMSVEVTVGTKRISRIKRALIGRR